MVHNLLRRARNVRRDEGGFTLIELLIVIIILGVLAAIVVFSVRGIVNNSQQNACDIENRTVETAVEAYYAKKGSYPANVAALTADPDKFLRDTPSWTTVGANGAVTTTCP